MKPYTCGQKGQVLVLFTMLVFVLIGIAALALDLGRAYGVKAKLNAAVDAAAIAGGRVISKGEEAVKAQATNVFGANYPAQTLGTTGTTLESPVLTYNQDGSWTVTVAASATLPTSFGALVGWQDLPVRASATSIVRTVDLILVLDSSHSLTDPIGSPVDTLKLLKNAAKGFIKNFDALHDRVGIVRFASGSVLEVPITETKGFSAAALNQAIDEITLGGVTVSEDALRIAKAQLDAITSQNNLRAIVFFTDGAPNTFAGKFSNGGAVVSGNLYSQIDDMDGPDRPTMIWKTNSCADLQGYYNDIDNLPDTDFTGKINLRSDLNPPTRSLDTSGGLITNTRCNVNKAAHNMLENIANMARSEKDKPINILTIGLGDGLLSQECKNADKKTNGCGYSDNDGEMILRRIANVPDKNPYYTSSQPAGLFAFAANPADLQNAFQQVANWILRLSK
jgi:Flp pilus assembly protein TadG